MKKIYVYLLGVILLLVSCEKDPIVTESYVSVVSEQVSATSSSLSIRCNIKSNVYIDEVYIENATAIDPYSYVGSKAMTKSGTSYIATLTGLKSNTDYYIRYRVEDRRGACIHTDAKKYRTPVVNLPTVTTSAVTNVGSTIATVGGNVTSDGGAAVTERGVVYSTSQNPTTSSSKKTSGSGTGSFSVSLSGLSKSTIYYVRAYAINSRGVSYGEQKSFATKNSSGSVNGYDYVDLGLSVKWATCNVGADSPEDYGDYFAWGETKPKSTYKWSTYEWCQGSTTTLTKYCTYSSYGKVDNKTQLDLSDDAARANWGGSWRMPTHDELTELREKCSWTGTTQNGVEGYKVTSKTNGNSIFLPAAGYRYVSSLLRAGSYGYYWSSSLCTDDPLYARYVYFNSSGVGWYDDYRGNGQSVRPVCP